MPKFLRIVLFILISTPLYATTYRITTSGSGTTCSQASPCATIALGLSKLAAGDTLEIGDGTWAESNSSSSSLGTNVIPSGTDDSHRTTVKAINTRGVTITYSGSYNGLRTQLGIYGKHYITIDGIIFDGSSNPGGMNAVNLIGADTSSTISHHVTVQNSTMIGSQYVGCVATQGYVSDTGIRHHDLNWNHNVVHDCGLGAGVAFTIHGFYIWSSDTLIDSNEIYNTDSQCIQIYDSNPSDPTDINNITISNNYIHDCGVLGIRLGGGSNNLAYNNIVNHTGYQQAAAGIWVAPESITGYVYNNTVTASRNDGGGNPSYGCINAYGGNSGAIAKNNVCYDNTNNTINGMNGGTATNLTTSTNPFSNYAGLNFHLAAASAPIDTGTNLASVMPSVDRDGNTRPIGAAWDIGAYEYGAVAGSITVSLPSTGLSYKRPNNQTVRVEWTSASITGTVDIQYSLDCSYYYDVVSVAYNSSPYFWDAAVPASSNVCVKVKQGGVSGTSGVFTIKGRYLKGH